MKKIIYILITILFFSCQEKEFKIIPIEDDYAKQNGGQINDDVFLINGFRNDKESIKKIFQYIETTIKPRLPFNVSINDCVFIFDREDVTFDDGAYTIHTDNYLWFAFNKNDYDFFKIINLKRTKENEYSYTIENENVVINYNAFNIDVLRYFINIARKTHKNSFTKVKYILINKNTSKIDCKIEYNNYIKGEAFKIEIY